ncbi:uncharacterized protein PpBr36_06215 [Pyricularia pennisetigena]|uniref:uncharacterized protein n=1 Tax=Pyricularia pennisetigena TaxID=1578925 RepID=UPI0011519DF8|nr:uncharacterized protein PpBr36_06215 [Pyricularia pennisetigena]TLS23170.1 hypothetical protein PpBr36_06215 [Pyricularia pennisetigena]
MDSPSLSPTVLDDVRDLAQTAGSVYRLLHHQTKTHLTDPFQLDLQALTGLLLRLTGVVHSLLLHLQTLSDESPQRNPTSNAKLTCLSHCADILGSLQDQWQDDVASREGNFPGAANLRRVHDDLLVVLTRFDITLYSTTWTVAVGTLSRSLPSTAAPREQDDHAFTIIANRAPPEAQHLIRSNWEYHHSNLKLQWLLEQRCEGTGEWLIGIDVVQQWLRGDHRFALLSGSAGCGKTFLTATLLEQLSKRVATHTVPLCYHFADPFEANELRDILQPLTLQMLTQYPKAWQAYLDFMLAREIQLDQELYPELSCLRDVRLLVPLVKTLLSLPDKSYIVLDGLDGLIPDIACELLEILLECNGLQILVLSRPLPLETCDRIRNRLEAKAAEHIVCEIGSNLGDIQACIREIAARNDDSAFNSHMAPEKLESLVLKSGISPSDSDVHFQLLKCRLWYLQTRDRLGHSSLAALDQPNFLGYTHLEELYKAVVDLIKSGGSSLQLGIRPVIDFPPTVEERYNTLKRALQWLVVITKQGSKTPSMACSKRAFFEGLSVSSDPDAESLDTLIPSYELESQYSWLLDLFAHEVQVKAPTDQRRADHVDTTESYRYCIHNRSLVEFALKNLGDFDSRPGETWLTSACLRFLNMSDHSVKRDRRQTEATRLKHPFFEFAAAWWPSIGSRVLGYVQPPLLKLFKEHYNFLNWLDAYLRTHCVNKGHGRLQSLSSEDTTGNKGIWRKNAHTPLDIAVSLGLSPMLADLEAHLQQCKQLFPRLYTSEQESTSNLLQLALIGPRALMTVSTLTGPTSIDVKGTIAYLLTRKLNPEERGRIPSLAAHALLVCAELRDNKKVFFNILSKFPSRPYGRNILHTRSFAAALERLDAGRFADFQNAVCEDILDVDAVAHAKDPYYQSDDEDGTDEEDDDGEKDHRSSDRCTAKYLVQLAWKLGNKNKLECVRMDVDRPIRCEDWQFMSLWARTHKRLRVDWIKRLLQDPRRPVNKPLVEPISNEKWLNREDSLQTPLHLLAEVARPSPGIISWIQALLDLGADVSARDGRERTPLHLVESPVVLEMFLRFGADLGSRDADGRTLWHVVAYNHDVEMLEALAKLDPAPLSCLRSTTTGGRTPLAEALGNYQGSKSAFQACTKILELCSHDALSFASDVPLLHMAAKWANEPSILKELEKAGAVCPDAIARDGGTVYHFLSPHVTPDFVKTLEQLNGIDDDLLVKLNRRGLTAFESWIDSFFEYAREQSSFRDPIRIPNKKTRSCVLKVLLAPRVVSSKSPVGLTFWERVCFNCLPELFGRRPQPQELNEFPADYLDYIDDILQAMAASGAIEFYEEDSSNCALVPFVANVVLLDDVLDCAHLKSRTEGVLYEFIEVLLSKTRHVEPLRNNQMMADLLCNAAVLGFKSLARSLLAHGVGIDTVGLRGESLRGIIDELKTPRLVEYLEVLPS